MINTDKVVGFYTDCFGNEIDVHEQIEKYTVWYKGKIFEGDGEGYNEHRFDRWEDAKAIYDAHSDIVCITDNEFGFTFAGGEWEF